MLWKYVKSLLRSVVLSIAIRLTLLYAAVTFVTVLIVSCLLYYTLATSFEHQAKNFLLKELHSVRNLLIHSPQPLYALRREIIIEPSIDMGGDHYYIRVLRPNGSVVLETPGMQMIVPLSSKNYLNNQHLKHIMLLSSAVKLYSGDYYIVQLALSVKNQQDVLHDYQERLFIILLCSVLSSILMGAWLTKKSMFPIKAMAKTLRHMTMNKLHMRLDAHQWPVELLEMAVELNQMLSRLEQSFTRLKQFSADLAHEIRTPITNLLGEAEVALRQARTPEDYQKILSSAMEEYNRLHALVSGLLFLAETENPQMQLNYHSIAVREVIDSVTEYYAAVVEEKNIHLSCEGEAAAWVDPVLFRRVVNNLISNELKYTPNHGEISIKINSLTDGVEIVIVDNGPGIASKHLPHLFERFYRTDEARSQGEGGLGLGLAIVKSIVDLHKGSIKIESELGKGTKTILFFPKQR